MSKCEVRGSSREELLHAPTPEAGAAAGRTNPTSKEQWLPWAQESLEELSHVEGQEGRQWGDTPRPR